MHSSTFSKLPNPLTLKQAQFIINPLVKYNVEIIYQKPAQLKTFFWKYLTKDHQEKTV